VSVTISRHVAAEWAWGVVIVALATLLVSVLAGRALGLAHLRYALAVPAGVLLGSAGVVGFALGGLCHSLLVGGPLLAGGAMATGDVMLVVLGYAVWDWQSPAGLRSSPVRALATYVAAVFVGTIGGVAIVSVSLEILGSATVVSILPVLLFDRLSAGLLAGLVVLFGLAAVTGSDPLGGHRDGPSTRTILGVLTVAAVWLVGIYTVSLIRRDVVAFPSTRASLLNAVPDPLGGVIAIVFGGLYRPLLVVTAILALSVMIWLFARSDYGLLSRGSNSPSR
jgi:hypothetical protein